MRIWDTGCKVEMPETELRVNPEHVDTIIRTVCLLHNIIIDKEAVNETVAMTQITPEDNSNVRSSRRYNRAKQNACSIRDRFMQYFNAEGATYFQ
jgi:2-phosphoglycerate kinase